MKIKPAITICLFLASFCIGACRPHPCYFCKCVGHINNADSNVLMRIGAPSTFTAGEADSLCHAWQARFPSDTCSVIIQQEGTPM